MTALLIENHCASVRRASREPPSKRTRMSPTSSDRLLWCRPVRVDMNGLLGPCVARRWGRQVRGEAEQAAKIRRLDAPLRRVSREQALEGGNDHLVDRLDQRTGAVYIVFGGFEGVYACIAFFTFVRGALMRSGDLRCS